MIASLSMYDWPEVREANDAFWEILAEELIDAGFEVPHALSSDGEGDEHWLHPDLLLSQTCGYPYATRLSGKVHLLATPCYAVEGCEAASYSSAIIVRRKSGVASLDEALSGSLAFNGKDSLSGYRCFIPLIGDPVSRFSSSQQSGGHRQSAIMVANGEADCAAIDAVCWDMFQRFEPEATERLRVLQWGPQFPALPYITRLGWSSVELEQLRQALERGIKKAASDARCADLKIAGCRRLDLSDYDDLRNLGHNGEPMSC